MSGNVRLWLLSAYKTMTRGARKILPPADHTAKKSGRLGRITDGRDLRFFPNFLY
jgi:hypothetical protein